MHTQNTPEKGVFKTVSSLSLQSESSIKPFDTDPSVLQLTNNTHDINSH